MTIKEKRGKVRDACIGYADLCMCGTTCPLMLPTGAYVAQLKGSDSFGCLSIESAPESDLDKALELIVKYNTEAPTKTNNTPIKDSGDRREFTSGAVRDMAEGKGRCDLLPLDVFAEHYTRQGQSGVAHVFMSMYEYQQSGNTDSLYDILKSNFLFPSQETMLLDLAKHYENGAKKYGENNWQKGIDTWSYIDSAVRHYLKTLRGDNDEPHSAAFIWNIVACIWTCKHKPEFNTYRKASENEK